MKKGIKAVITVLLSVILTLSTFSVAFGAIFTEKLPIVYVLGKVDVIYEDKDGNSNDMSNKTLYPVSIDDLEIIGSLQKIMPAYLKAFAKEYIDKTATEQDKLDAWDEYGLELYGLVGDIFDDVALDNNGEPRGNSGIIWDWDQNYRNGTGENILTDTMDAYGRYGLYDYTFHYDWRLDMFHNAELLNAYINDVLEATGRDKCVLISRCYGCNLVAAYINEYGSDKIETNILYCSTAEGTVVCGEMFSGRFGLNPEGMARFADGALFGEDSGLLSSIIKSNVGESHFDEESFDTLSSIVNKIYSRISHTMMPKTLITSFASMPGYWSLVNDEYYLEAKDFVFGDKADTEYRKLVEKIDAYHYPITNNAAQIFVDAYESGMNYANLVKYGVQISPIVESCNVLGDGIVEVTKASFGATTSGNVGDKFSSEYISLARKNNTYKYIDPAHTIDASTCIYPDYTWFVEGVDHFDFPPSVDRLLLRIARYDGQMTVFDDTEFPQYLKYEGEGNLLNWAGGLYLENSRDKTAGTLRIIVSVIKRITSIFTRIFNISAIITGNRK